MRLAALVTVFVAFTVWSLSIVAGQGFSPLAALLTGAPWAQQLFVDLCLALGVAWVWLFQDARRHGIRAWPYVLGTLAAGSIGVLAYLVHREVVVRGRSVASGTGG